MTLFSIGCTDAEPNPAAHNPAGADESKEPNLKYTLFLGNTSVELIEGEPVRIDGTFEDPEVTLTAAPYRVFPYQGISFRYPRTFSFEADLDGADSRIWTLSGNDLKIMYFVHASRLTADEFVESMRIQFGPQNCTVAAATPLSFDGDELPGTTLTVDFRGHRMVQDAYAIPSADTHTKFLVLQDNLDESGRRSSEGTAARKLLERSLTTNPMRHRFRGKPFCG